jgi:hypothetical protein
MDIILDKPFFHTNDTLKQKGIGACERVRRNLKWYTKGKRPARVVARSNEGSGEGKAEGGLTTNLYQRVTFAHARVMLPLILLRIYACKNTKYIHTNGTWYQGHTERYL